MNLFWSEIAGTLFEKKKLSLFQNKKSGQKIDKLFLTHWDTFHLENEFHEKTVKETTIFGSSSKLGHFIEV